MLCLLLCLTVAQVDTGSVRGVRSPSFARDGRVVMSIGGDLYLRAAGASLTDAGSRNVNALVRLTADGAWDRDPAFAPDGRSIVYASDRAGQYDVWRITLTADNKAGMPERLTNTPASERAPTVAPNGDIAFVRGVSGSARVYIRTASGEERRLDARDAAESAPVYSPDGSRIAFIVSTEADDRVIVRNSNATAAQTGVAAGDATVNSDRNAQAIAWAPDGTRLAFSSRTGVYVAPVNGRYGNFTSAHHGDLAWAPDGRTLLIAEYDEANVSYNGDPDRGLDRAATDRIGERDRLYSIAAPLAPDHELVAAALSTADDRTRTNANAFDRVWQRSDQLYFLADSSSDGRARRRAWENAKSAYRPAALAAQSDSALQLAIYMLLQHRPTLRSAASGRAAVSSAHPVATAAGLEMLRKGGNVIDAAVAVSFTLGVVEPDASGVGGYGEMVIARNGQQPTLIEFMTRVPEDASLSNTSLMKNGRYPADGPVLTNIPGTTAGMYAAFTKYGSGKVTWAEALAPAIHAARDGYVVSEGLATTLATEREHFVKYEGSRALFFRNGEPLTAGDTIHNTDLAWVLEHIAKDGADGFYRGEVAERWVKDMSAKGNAMRLTDLARYFAPERAPVSGTYRGYTIYSSAPPVSGGADLVGRLNLLEHFPAPKRYTDDAATLHAALTSWFLVPSSRNRIADPAMWPVNVAPIIDKDTASARWACYDPARALRPADTRGDSLPCLLRAGANGRANGEAEAGSAKSGSETDADTHINADESPEQKHTDAPATADQTSGSASPCGEEHAAEMTHCHSAGTTAFTVADNEGNVVAVTQTLGTWGGNFYVTPGLGFLSNDKLTSYGTDPTQYGSRLPFARHGSTLAPTVVFKGSRPIFAVGAAGNAWITSAVYQTLLGALDYGLGPQEALELPRFLPGGGTPIIAPSVQPRVAGDGMSSAADVPRIDDAAVYNIQLEDGFAPDVIATLRKLGYGLTFVSLRGELREGYGAAVRIDGKTVTAGADPRRAGAAGAIR